MDPSLRIRMDILEMLKKHWFLAAMMVAIVLAEMFPYVGSREGPLNPEVTVKYGAISLIFLISGLSIKIEEVLGAVTNVKVHIMIQFFSLIFTPIFIKILTVLLHNIGVDSWILKGLITVGCLPPPVSTAVILTRAAGGNEAAAIVNSLLGCVLGILVTPFTLLFFLKTTTLVPMFSTIFQLSVTVVLPLALGQLIRFYSEYEFSNLPIAFLGQLALLLIIFATFCQTFINQDHEMFAHDILITVLLVVLILIFLTWFVFWLSSHMTRSFRPEDVVAIVFCSTHKSLTLGIPMLRILYEGYAHLSTISLPLLVYHPTQIILGGLIVQHLQVWMISRQQSRLRLEA